MKKRTILILTDKKGNTVDENGIVYGWYFKKEKSLCKKFCKDNNLIYREKKINVW